MTNRPDSVEELLEGVEEMKKQWHEDFDRHATGLPYGAQHMTNEQHAAWFFEMMKRYPPEPWITPEGQTVTLSPWLLALQHVEDGVKEMRRFNRTMLAMSMPEVSDE